MQKRVRWVALGLVVLVIACLGAGGYVWARQVQDSAEAGKSSVQAGLEALKSSDPVKAQASFVAAQDSFAHTESLLGPGWLRSVPFLGNQLDAVDQLAQVGREGAKAGEQVSALMAAATNDAGGLNKMLKIAKPYLLSMLDSFNRISVLVPQLKADGLVPPLANAVTEAKDTLAPLAPVFAKSDAISSLTRYLLSGDHRFLLVSQNNAELRPTGGFMGSYGLLRVGPDGLTLERYRDIATLPVDTLNLPKPAGARMGGGILRMRDGNWWLDFPTSGAMILKLYDHSAQPEPTVDGVIAIDLITVKTFLGEFGPITLKDYGKTITSDNMIQTLVVLIEQELAGKGTARKDPLRQLSEELLPRMLNLQASQLVPTSQMMVDLANQRRLQVFLQDSSAQTAIASLGWAGAMNVTADTTDLLAVANAVVWPSKMNMGVHKTIDYQVALNADGTAQTQLRLSYAKDARRLLKIQRQWFGDYLRVYRPRGTTLTQWSSTRSASTIPAEAKRAETKPQILTDAFGFPAITAGLGLLAGETRTETYASTVPQAIRPSETGAKDLHYRLLIVKQPDLEENPTTVSVTIPDGWAIAGANAWQRNSGTALAVASAANKVTVSTPLVEDTVVDIALTKP